MGYEAIFHYHPAKDTGGYDYEIKETFTKKLGKLDDIPIESLVSLIMTQLARRDKIIFDVEVYEYVKKKIPFKWNKNGILLKNKKINWIHAEESLEDNKIQEFGSLEIQNIEDICETPKEPTIKRIKNEIPTTNPVVSMPIRFENFIREPEFTGEYSGKKTMLEIGYVFTPGKSYPIFEERTSNIKPKISNSYSSYEETRLMEYKTIDDKGKSVWLPSLNFEAPEPVLSGMSGYQAPAQDNPLYRGIKQEPADQIILRRG